MADRYTTLTRDPKNVHEIIEMANALGLHWHMGNDDGARCRVYLFFDEEGKNNYLGGIYSDSTARLIKAIEDYCEGNVGPKESLLNYALEIKEKSGR